MTDYSTLGSEVSIVKSKIDALQSTTLVAQDIVFLAKALESLGNLLGINDILGATNTAIANVQSAASGSVNSVNSAGATQIAAVNSAGTASIANVNTAVSNYTLYANMGVF